jgi:hypothetical protein
VELLRKATPDGFSPFLFRRIGIYPAREPVFSTPVDAMTQTIANDDAAANPWQRSRSSDGGTSLMFWLMMLVLGVSAWGGVTWAASSVLANKGPEKLLRVDLLLPKLNSNHGDGKPSVSHTSEPTPSDPAHPKDRATTAFHLPNLFGQGKVKVVETPHHVEKPAEPPHFLGPTLPPPPAAVETCEEPVVYLQPCTLQQGDSPMTRTWKTVTMYSLLTAAAVTLAPPPLLAQEDKTDKGIVVKTEALEKLQKSVDKLIKRMDALEQKPGLDEEAVVKAFRAEFKKVEDGALDDINRNIKKVRDEMSAIQAEQLRQKQRYDDLSDQIKALRERVAVVEKTPSTPAVDKAFMEEFRSSMKAMQETIAKIGPIEKRDSAYLNGKSAFATTGRVAIVNLYSEDLLFVINGVGYRVPARGSKMVENVPSGALNYLVHSERWGTLENRVTSIAAGDTFTVTASNPR